MKVLFWSETFWPRVGGVERLAAALLPALRERGHEFSVVTWDHAPATGRDCFNGFGVHRFDFFAGAGGDRAMATLAQLEEVRDLKRRFEPDLVHVNSCGRSAWFHLASNAARAPTLVTLHQPLGDGAHARESVAGHLLGAASWIACCSKAVKESVHGVLPAIERRTSVIDNALPGIGEEPPPIPFEPPQLLFVGRLIWDKGLDRLLDALPPLFDRIGAVRLVVAGDGPLRADLEARAAALGLGSRVHFTGEVSPDAVRTLMAKASVVVVPSRVEGFGLVALEAAAMGRPVVATDAGGLPEVVHHEATGLVVGGDDMVAFASAVERLLSDPSAARRMGALARTRARERFDWERHVTAYDVLYRRLAC